MEICSSSLSSRTQDTHTQKKEIYRKTRICIYLMWEKKNKETVYGKDAREEDAVASNHHPKD